ncbi:hypothetical protein EJB05_47592 [Eragrostis curvula]|uniref:Proliferating cell nuclear antigen n=1 Tax=Eragrostis curvula TaxID=38414 RepID=A0A5J9T0Y6_9POAL|nr:hypothetical protein EJB05_47592 [Eragrostis curvula]
MDSDSDSDSNPVLELRMKKECFLKNAQEALSVPFSRATVDFSRTGLVLKARDTSGGSYAVLHLSSKAFDYYSCDHKHFSLNLNLAAVSKIFSFANNNDIITIKHQLEDGYTFPISLGSPDSHVISCFHLDVQLNAIGVHVDVPDFPESIYQAIVCMPSAKFKHFCDKLSCDTGDRNAVITVSVDKDNVRFFTDRSSAIVHLQTQNGDKELVACDGGRSSSLLLDGADMWALQCGRMLGSLPVTASQRQHLTEIPGCCIYSRRYPCSSTLRLAAHRCQRQHKPRLPPNEAPHIVMKEKISLTFSLRYLKNFSKASTLSDQVTIKLSPNLLVVECMIKEMGYIRYHVMPADKEGLKRKIRCRTDD